MLGKMKTFRILMMLLWGFTTALCLILNMKKCRQEKPVVHCARKIWGLFVAVSIVSVLLVLIDANMGNHMEIWKPYKNALIFGDAWGTKRGMIWRFAGEFFAQKSSVLDKLIGNGPDTFYIITMDYFKKAMKAAGNTTYDSVHNEYLEYLVTIGILGAIAYLGILSTGLQQIFKKPKNNYAIACGIAVLAYATQAIINIAIPITTPILMMLLYVGISIAKESVDGKIETEKTEKESYEI